MGSAAHEIQPEKTGKKEFNHHNSRKVEYENRKYLSEFWWFFFKNLMFFYFMPYFQANGDLEVIGTCKKWEFTCGVESIHIHNHNAGKYAGKAHKKCE